MRRMIVVLLAVLLACSADAQTRKGRRVMGLSGVSRVSSLPYAGSLIPGTTSRASAYFVDTLYGNDSWSGHRSDSAWKSLTKVNAATFVAGDTVYFRRSQVWKNWLFKSNNGAWGSPIVYTSYGYGANPRFDVSGTSRVYAIYTSGTYNVFDGIDVRGSSGMGVNISGNYGEIKNSTVSNMGAEAVYLNGIGCVADQCLIDTTQSYGFVLNKDSCIVRRSSGYRCGAYPFYVTGAYCLVDSCVSIPNTGTNCIRVNGRGAIVSNSVTRGGAVGVNMNGPIGTVLNCVVSNSTTWGISLLKDSSAVRGCTVSDVWNGAEHPTGGGDGISMQGKCDTALYNNISGCYQGIGISGVRGGSLVAYNSVYHAIVNGISNYCTDTVLANTAYNNTVIHHVSATGVGHGIAHQPASGGKWVSQNNLVYSDYAGANNNTDCYTIGDTTRTNITTDYNLVYRTPGATLTLFHATYKLNTLAEWQALCVRRSWTGGDANSIVADPLLVNYTTDFRLQAGSPAINAGVDVGLTRDIQGNPIVGAPDIGAYEYQP